MPRTSKDPDAIERAVEPKPDRTRRSALPLTSEAARIIAETARYTGKSQEEVKKAIADAKAGGDRTLLEALVESCCEALTEANAKTRETDRLKIFGKKPPPEVREA